MVHRLLIHFMVDMGVWSFWEGPALCKTPTTEKHLRGRRCLEMPERDMISTNIYSLRSDSYADISQKKLNTWTKNRITQNCCKPEEHKYKHLAQLRHSRQSAQNIRFGPPQPCLPVSTTQWDRRKMTSDSSKMHYYLFNIFLSCNISSSTSIHAGPFPRK